MVLTRFLKPEARQGLIDTREAMNLWQILVSCYNITERLEADEVMTHDLDLKYMMTQSINEFKKEAEKLKIQLEKFQIKGPDMGRLSSQWSGNPEVSRDELMATLMLTFFQKHFSDLMRAYRNSVTNDSIRQMFHKMLLRAVERTDTLIKYLKLKGWMESPPIYPNTPAATKEKICCGAAGELWAQLSRRYDNFRKTGLYSTLAHDQDFKIILDLGISDLRKQITILEEECQKFGIPLPKRPSEVIVATVNTDLIDDDQMYRDVLDGLQGAAMIHAASFKQCAFNDGIRSIFKKMMFEEFAFFEKFIKYGKVKGWLNPTPIFKV